MRDRGPPPALEPIETGRAIHKRRLWRTAGAVFSLAILLLSVVVLMRTFATVNYWDLRAAIQATLVLGYAIVVLHARVAGSLWLVVLVLLLLVIGVVNLGIALSFFARNELQVIQFIPLVLLPQVFLGGLFWPVAVLWKPLTWLSVLFPVTHAVHALRHVMLGGEGLGGISADLVGLVAFAAAMILLGVLVLRRQRA